MKRLLKFYRFAFAWENYLLLVRAIAAARLVRRLLKEETSTPGLAAALSAVKGVYLPPQPGWQISEAKRVALFAGLVVNLPVSWGRCVQQSLITYRLLNGYGVPAKICFGIRCDNPTRDGHAWVVTMDGSEEVDPDERFQLIYTSHLPE